MNKKYINYLQQLPVKTDRDENIIVGNLRTVDDNLLDAEYVYRNDNNEMYELLIQGVNTHPFQHYYATSPLYAKSFFPNTYSWTFPQDATDNTIGFFTSNLYQQLNEEQRVALQQVKKNIFPHFSADEQANYLALCSVFRDVYPTSFNTYSK
nr:hypothetical protein [Microctonus hyperodae filamentous virus]